MNRPHSMRLAVAILVVACVGSRISGQEPETQPRTAPDLLEEVRQRQRMVDLKVTGSALAREALAVKLFPVAPTAAVKLLKQIEQDILFDVDLSTSCRNRLLMQLDKLLWLVGATRC
jgi:hypothetical protein